MLSPKSIVTFVCLVFVLIDGRENVELPSKSHGVNVSSKIDFDLDAEKEPGISVVDDKSTFFFVDENRIVTSTESPSNRIFTRAEDSKAQFARSTSRYGPVRRRRIDLSKNQPAPTPMIINNVRIVVNDNEIVPRLDSAGGSCQNGVCNVTVSSKLDADGNFLTDVHLSIVSHLGLASRPKINVGDVPIINGFRGAGFRPGNKPPQSRPSYPPKFPFSQVPRNNIPQVQTRGHREWTTNEVGSQPRSGFDRWSSRQFPRYGWNGFRGSQAPSRPWQPPVTVDDKIDAPFRKIVSSSVAV